MATDNPFAQPARLYAWDVTASQLSEHLLDILATDTDKVAIVTSDTTGVLTLFTPCPPGTSDMTAYLAAAELASDTTLTIQNVTPVESQDWVSLTQAAIQPMVIGNIVIIGSHHTPNDVPHGKTPIVLDVGAAFGTGEHATTSGCLQAIAAVTKRQRIRRTLDMGCGTAILGMAVTKQAPCHVLAVDNDPVAVRVAQANIRRNGLSSHIKTCVSEGFRAPMIAYEMPYDLIIANILARPVRRMLPAIANHLRPGGYAILSGFYVRDIPLILSGCKMAGLRLIDTRRVQGWATLTVQR